MGKRVVVVRDLLELVNKSSVYKRFVVGTWFRTLYLIPS